MTGGPRRTGPDISFVIEFDFASVGNSGWQSNFRECFSLGIKAIDRVIVCTTNPDTSFGLKVQGLRSLFVSDRNFIDLPLRNARIECDKHT